MEQTQAASSAAVAEPSPNYEIPRSGTSEYAQWRIDGTLPEKKQETKPKEDPAPSTAGESQQTAGGEKPPKETQEQKPSKRRPDVEDRFKRLTDELKAVKAELARRPQTQAESSPAKNAPPENYQQWRKAFKPVEWIQRYATDNPEATYEDAQAAMADHLADVRDQFRNYEQQRDSQQQSLKTKVEDARTRYGQTFDEVLWPTLESIVSDAQINPNVKAMFNDSDVLPDLVYTIGSDPATLARFLAMAKNEPGKAIRYLAVVEAGVTEELAKGKAPRNGKGQFVESESAPAKRGPESAAEPPISIGNRGASTMNESERAFQAIKRGDGNATRQWMEAENRKALARRRGI